jgi:hypothetical protein
MTVWIGLLLAASVTTNNVAIPPFQNVSRLTAGINQLAFSRVRQFSFRWLMDDYSLHHGPLLVLVRHDPADRHIDYVSNHPSLAEPLLIGRMPADSRTSEEETARIAAEAFPDHTRILFDAATGQYSKLP